MPNSALSEPEWLKTEQVTIKTVSDISKKAHLDCKSDKTTITVAEQVYKTTGEGKSQPLQVRKSYGEDCLRGRTKKSIQERLNNEYSSRTGL
jgi:hypothetical protein